MLLLVARKRNKERVGSIMSHKPVSGSKLAIVKSVLGIVIGAAIAAIGLEAFLIPNSLTDGGVVGVSIQSISLHTACGLRPAPALAGLATNTRILGSS